MLIVNAHVHNNVVVISIKGTLNIDNTFEVEKVFKEQITIKPKVVGFDCKDMANLDSSGLGLFVKFLKESKNSNFELIFFNITGNILSLFDISKLNNFFNIMTGEEFQAKYL